MVQMQTLLYVADNSGAKMVRCIGVIGKSKYLVSHAGEIIVVSVVSTIAGSKIKKGTVTRAVIVRTKQTLVRSDGTSVKFHDNSVVLLNKDKSMIATRVFGSVVRELRERGFSKVVSLAKEVL